MKLLICCLASAYGLKHSHGHFGDSFKGHHVAKSDSDSCSDSERNWYHGGHEHSDSYKSDDRSYGKKHKAPKRHKKSKYGKKKKPRKHGYKKHHERSYGHKYAHPAPPKYDNTYGGSYGNHVCRPLELGKYAVECGDYSGKQHQFANGHYLDDYKAKCAFVWPQGCGKGYHGKCDCKDLLMECAKGSCGHAHGYGGHGYQQPKHHNAY
ncbi:MAG: hypothetical protein MHM6MM_004567 [Cercozoa sp. M6MM]